MTNYETERKYKGHIILPTVASYGTIWLWKSESSDDFNDASDTLAQAKADINWSIKEGIA